MVRIHLRRSAFTLIELLVVIAIIAILAALLMGGVMAFLRKGPEVETRNDILGLSEALQKFYEKHKFYPPDKIRLYSNLNSYTGADPTPPLNVQSITYLNAIWPSIDRTQTFNWAGTATIPTTGIVLEGDQCLVFFLGGMPNGAGQAPSGFFNNPKNPTIAIGTSTDKAKYFEFQSARCQLLHSGNPFPSYLDPHNRDHKKNAAFVYFTSGKRADGYAANNSLFGVSPYVQTPGTIPKFYNSSTFQLISAGPDGVFGAGGAWTPGGGNAATKDDVSNFHGSRLGAQ